MITKIIEDSIRAVKAAMKPSPLRKMILAEHYKNLEIYTMKERLKPCPFCGGKDLGMSEKIKHPGATWYLVECHVCGGQTEPHKTKVQAMNFWNMRTDNDMDGVMVDRGALDVLQRQAGLKE